MDKFLVVWSLLVLSAQHARADQECFVDKYEDVAAAVANCTTIVLGSFVVPAGETLRLHLLDGTNLTFNGYISFEYKEWAGPLVVINATNAQIHGKDAGVLDGNGKKYWDGLGEWGSLKPKFFTIQLHDSVMGNLYILNGPVHVAYLVDSTNVELHDWFIDNLAGDPELVNKNKSGHNTDGFDFFNVTNVVLRDSQVYNQDDCVAIRHGANILVDNMYCYGGHGLSVSVGFSNITSKQNELFNVTIRNSVLEKGENGIHVKTHIDSIDGLIQNLTYRDIKFKGMTNYGINIQQNYKNMPPNSSFPDPLNNIPIKGLTLDNVIGEVEDSAVPIYIKCADDGCFDWNFDTVQVVGSQKDDCNYKPTGFACLN